MTYKDFSYCENVISSGVKANLISSHVKISTMLIVYLLSSLPSLIVEGSLIYCYMIGTSWKIFRKYSAAFGNLRKMSENDRRCSSERRTHDDEILIHARACNIPYLITSVSNDF